MIPLVFYDFNTKYFLLQLSKCLKNNINTEKKLIKEVSEQQNAERKSFESKMKQEYKLKKERWKREMAEVDTPKRYIINSFEDKKIEFPASISNSKH